MEASKREYLLHCGIRSGWHSKKLSDFTNDKEALGVVEKYLQKVSVFRSRGVGLFLYGSNGTGKSHLMNCAFMELVKLKLKVRVFSMDEIVEKFTASWYSEAEKQELRSILNSTDFIGIDEFGKNLDKDGKPIYLPELVKRVMESVIRYRVQSGKPIWFTSNTDPKFVKDVFSEDIASLLNEAVIGVCVRGGDYRKKINAELKSLL